MVLELCVALFFEQTLDLSGKSRVRLLVEVEGDLGQKAQGRINDGADDGRGYSSMRAFDRMQLDACLVEISDVLFQGVRLRA